MAITSKIRPITTVGEFELRNWQIAGLLKPSAIKPIIATLEISQILRSLGKLSPIDQSALRKLLRGILR